jgi:hypothetical protein
VVGSGDGCLRGRRLRRGWLRAVAAGLAVALCVLAVVSYLGISAEIRKRAEFVFAGNLPADGCITLLQGCLLPDQEAAIASEPGVAAAEFTALTDVVLPSGLGKLEGVDFASCFFDFTLSSGRLPLAPGEAVVDSLLGRIAGFEVGSVFKLKKLRGEPLQLRVTGVLDASAKAPSGILVDRSYCLLPEVGGLLARAWVRVAAPAGAEDVVKSLTARLPGAVYETNEFWRQRFTGNILWVEKAVRFLLAVLVTSMLVVLWVLGSFFFSQNSRLLRVAYALGLAPGHVRSLAIADGLLSGVVASGAVALSLALNLIRHTGVIGGSWWALIAGMLPVLVMLVLSLGFRPSSLVRSG